MWAAPNRYAVRDWSPVVVVKAFSGGACACFKTPNNVDFLTTAFVPVPLAPCTTCMTRRLPSRMPR